MKTLVLGGTGFVGRLAEVAALARARRRANPGTKETTWTLICGD